MKQLIALLLTTVCCLGQQISGNNVVIRTSALEFAFGTNGVNASFKSLYNGTETITAGAYVSRLKATNGTFYNASYVALSGNTLTITYGASGIAATYTVTTNANYFKWKFTSVTDTNFQHIRMLNIQTYASNDFSGCMMPVTLSASVAKIPGIVTDMQALVYPMTGTTNAEVAVMGERPTHLSKLMREVTINEYPAYMQNTNGGAFASISTNSRTTYLVTYYPTLTVGSSNYIGNWIQVANMLGVKALDLIQVFNYGDYTPNSTYYPNGLVDVSNVVSAIHAAGLKAYNHSYSFCINKTNSIASPTPDSRLGYDNSYTLYADITDSATTIRVNEDTSAESTTTKTLWIGNEQIEYTSRTTSSPFQFTGCTRGASGTTRAAHTLGDSVKHFRQFVGLLLPDPDSTLYTTIASNLAYIDNYCKFDGHFLDALDGASNLKGDTNIWYYASLFTTNYYGRLDHPIILESATTQPFMYPMKTSMGTKDFPTHDYTTNIDYHITQYDAYTNTFYPMNYGWWYLGLSANQITPSDLDYAYTAITRHGNGFMSYSLGAAPVDYTTNATIAALFRKVSSWERHLNSTRHPIGRHSTTTAHTPRSH